GCVQAVSASGSRRLGSSDPPRTAPLFPYGGLPISVGLGSQADPRPGGQKCPEQECCFCCPHGAPVAHWRRKAGVTPCRYQDSVSEPCPRPTPRRKSHWS